MASRAEHSVLDLHNPSRAEAWLRQLAALARSKGIKDVAADEETATDACYGITDLFISRAGLDSLETLSLMAAPRELESMSFAEIKQLVLRTIRPKKKLVIAERTAFLAMKQYSSETTMDYYRRLRDGARFCEFDCLGTAMSKEDELITMCLIDGLALPERRNRILQLLQEKDLTLEEILTSLQQLEQINVYNIEHNFEQTGTIHAAKSSGNHEQRTVSNCSFCGESHKRGRCPAFGKICNICKKKNHFCSCLPSSKNTSW